MIFCRQIMFVFFLQKAHGNNEIHSYMVAGCNKFLRIYYARVKLYLNLLEQQEPIPFIDGSDT